MRRLCVFGRPELMEKPVVVGMLMSYDYECIRNSLPCLYPYADKIVLALDRDFKTWAGESFVVHPSFFEWLKVYDVDRKVFVYKDKFYSPNLDVMGNDTRQRRMLAEQMGDVGWYIQVDADEYFVDFRAFVKELKKKEGLLVSPKQHPVSIMADWISLFKQTRNGFLYIDPPTESAPIATNNPQYLFARQANQKCIYTPCCIIHQSWARSAKEVKYKLKNWSHHDDFDTNAFYKMWDSVGEHNYYQFRNFHPVDGPLWQRLAFLPGVNIKMFSENYEQSRRTQISSHKIWFRNHPQARKFILFGKAFMKR